MSETAAQPPIRLNADFSQPALMRATEAEWSPSPSPGVTRRMLDRVGGEKARVTSVVRYAPNSRFPSHAHDLGEEFFVLSGVFSDVSGDFEAGTYVRNPPGSAHAPWTEPGCVILVKLRQMHSGDDAFVRIPPQSQHWRTIGEAHDEALLYEDLIERVTLQRLTPGQRDWTPALEGGGELYVLEGAVETNHASLVAGDWLRLPPGDALTAASPAGALVWFKQGHLGRVLGLDETG